jgi:putative FmdB family regulatory protein
VAATSLLCLSLAAATSPGLTPFQAPRIVSRALWSDEGLYSMPTYEYRCAKCTNHFVRNESIVAHGRKKAPCPKCKSVAVSQVLTPSYVKTVKKS